MTEFEKWREQDNKGAGIWTTAAYKKGWKAALELVLTIFNKNIELSDLGYTYDIIDVYSMVEKELQATK